MEDYVVIISLAPTIPTTHIGHRHGAVDGQAKEGGGTAAGALLLHKGNIGAPAAIQRGEPLAAMALDHQRHHAGTQHLVAGQQRNNVGLWALVRGGDQEGEKEGGAGGKNLTYDKLLQLHQPSHTKGLHCVGEDSVTTACNGFNAPSWRRVSR